MELTSRFINNVKILSLSGSFNTQKALKVQEWLDQAASSEPANLVINLNEVNFIDSTGLATLVRGLKRSKQLNGDLRLCGLITPVRMIFELTRLDNVFEIYQTEAEAVNSFVSQSVP